MTKKTCPKCGEEYSQGLVWTLEEIGPTWWNVRGIFYSKEDAEECKKWFEEEHGDEIVGELTIGWVEIGHPLSAGVVGPCFWEMNPINGEIK